MGKDAEGVTQWAPWARQAASSAREGGARELGPGDPDEACRQQLRAQETRRGLIFRTRHSSLKKSKEISACGNFCTNAHQRASLSSPRVNKHEQPAASAGAGAGLLPSASALLPPPQGRPHTPEPGSEAREQNRPTATGTGATRNRGDSEQGDAAPGPTGTEKCEGHTRESEAARAARAPGGRAATLKSRTRCQGNAAREESGARETHRTRNSEGLREPAGPGGLGGLGGRATEDGGDAGTDSGHEASCRGAGAGGRAWRAREERTRVRGRPGSPPPHVRAQAELSHSQGKLRRLLHALDPGGEKRTQSPEAPPPPKEVHEH